MPDDSGDEPPLHEAPVADVMARIDWSTTSVGPSDRWPALLDALVRVLLASRFPMWMGWGPDLTFFYNDAYRRDTLGVKHPWAVGRPAREVWAEIWDDIGPRIEGVLQGQSTWDEALLLFLERSGYREETYHTFSYSPITDAAGGVQGLLCVVTEETDRVIGERRMTTLRRLASKLSGTRKEDEVYGALATELSKNPYDLPYTLTYVFEGADRARLASVTGVTAGSSIAPTVIERGMAGASWPIADIDGGGRTLVVDGVVERFGEVPCGAWDVPSDAAVVVPLTQPSQPRPTGFLVAGRNPYRPEGTRFVGFVELLAGQLAAGIAGARAYESERRRAEALAELDRAKTEFFSNVSHELRTPLTLILGPAEDALCDDLEPLAPAQAARLDVIRRNARRLRRLVNDMLDFSRIEGGRMQAETLPTDLAQVTRDVTMSFASAIERAGLELSVDCRPLPRPVHVDRDMWEKILLNLLSNALKFSHEGRITVSLVDGGDVVELSVSDTGVGIPAIHLPNLFQRFYRAPESGARSHEGTGIGLALVYELVQLHDGTVSVSSEEGAGSTFTVRLPYGSATTASGEPKGDSALPTYLDEALQWSSDAEDLDGPSVAVRSGRTANATVLVVDDNRDMRRYIARTLEPYWNVVTAPDGAAAREVLRGRAADLVLADVMMPRSDGFALLRALRADPRTATVPVVLLSARAGEDAAVEGLGAGADDYLVKPFSAVELLARVRSHLELAAMRSQEAAWRTEMVESLEEAVVVLDSTFAVIEVNPAFEQILGFPRTGTPYHPPFAWAPDPTADPGERRKFEALVEQVRTEGRFRGVVKVRHRDGHTVYVDAAVRSLVVDGERRFVAILRDVTAERLSAERESALAQLGIRLAEASDVEGVTEAGLSELRRVLGADRVGLASLGSPLPAEVASALRGGRVAVAPSATGVRSVGMAAPLDPPGGADAVWVEFGSPRRVGAADRSLFTLLCGYFGQALRRAQLFDANSAVATAMQRSILGPTDVPTGVAVRYVPAVQPLEVGGDWYDVIELPGGRLGLAVGDCVGRGLPAATVMGQLRSACRALLLQARTPAQVVAALDTFADRIPGATCTTVLCAIVDLAEHTLRFCGAGHVPGLLVGRGGSATWLHQPGSLPLAVMPDCARSETSVPLPPGSSLVLCTDGLVERRGESLEVGLERLADAVRTGEALAPDALADHLMREVLPARGQEDDVALVIYQEPASEDTLPFSMSVPADPSRLAEMRQRLAGWLATTAASELERSEIVLAVSEAVGNSIEHGYAFDGERRVRLSATLSGRHVKARIEDTGQWRPASGSRGDRGRGIQIMRGLMDRVTLVPSAEGTTVLLVRRVGRDG